MTMMQGFSLLHISTTIMRYGRFSIPLESSNYALSNDVIKNAFSNVFNCHVCWNGFLMWLSHFSICTSMLHAWACSYFAIGNIVLLQKLPCFLYRLMMGAGFAAPTFQYSLTMVLGLHSFPSEPVGG